MTAQVHAPCIAWHVIYLIAGDQDLICNHLGNRRWVDGLEWSGAQGWSQAQDKPWVVKGKQAGEVTSYGTLSFVKVFQAVSVGLLNSKPICLHHTAARAVCCKQDRLKAAACLSYHNKLVPCTCNSMLKVASGPPNPWPPVSRRCLA